MSKPDPEWLAEFKPDPEWVSEFIKAIKPEHDRRAAAKKREAADNELRYARTRFKKVMERIFENEVAKLMTLIKEPRRYSTKEWEKLITDFQWMARRLACVAKTMEQQRPLVRVDDTVDEPARITCKRLLAESFME